MMQFIKKLQKNWLFRKLSSVQLAVPLLLTIAAVTAYGTILESRYNAEYAKLIVYGSWWFQFLLFLLGVNILFAALSRIPYKIHHTGFVITHAGMIIILIGSFVTKRWGLDGQLRVPEGDRGQMIVLDNRILEIVSDTTFKRVQVPRSSSKLSGSELASISKPISSYLRITKYLPFVDPNKAYAPSTNGLTVDFTLESPFFKQSEWLNINSKPELQLGPAHLRLINSSSLSLAANKTKIETHSKEDSASANSDESPHPKKHKAVASKSAKLGDEKLIISDSKSQKMLKTVFVRDLVKKPISLRGIQISLNQVFKHASVSSNKITEGDGPINPALELILTKGAKTAREVLFAKYPDFSLNQAAEMGLHLVYKNDNPIADDGADAVDTSEQNMDVANSETESTNTHGMSQANVDSAASRPTQGNVIDFVFDQKTNTLTLELYKNGTQVLKQNLTKGNTIQTPWMGMKITLNDVNQGRDADSAVITETEVPKKTEQLPPSAIFVVPTGKSEADGFWLAEGQAKKINLDSGPLEAYYGRDIFRLPFALQLDKFYKKNYPGTETAISFESHVRINGTGDNIVISMNEPLKKSGYTLYQSSFEMQPGSVTASIFSVNKDPGRPIKYLGSIIMAIGIITFTLMRSRFYKRKVKTT